MQIEAQALLSSFRKKGAREAHALQERINLIQHCQALASGKIKDIPKDEFAAHLQALKHSGVVLTVPLTIKAFERQMDDSLEELLDQTNREAAGKIVNEFACHLLDMSPDPSSEGTQISARSILDQISDESKAATLTGSMSQDEAKAWETNMHKDCLLTLLHDM